ncbi:hypothetical protein LB524_11030 [Mesorhizobium sp. ESP6-5]|uniref:Uncharacterized protein n=1 Tax=Mesorhizobium australicum (strain HAMBI 3006 / LMG 24608 / WSM2073) TaxID=754035 RepID=L0KPP1_MESAW|nr:MULTISPECIES: hypothetical protein [unclassified Mesorhizobium]AGB47377.1 hypothetical protein Mesau_05065 [Mesorhizobium australicum WSM2073]MBZ9681423.1 hypothetical protein [Mesorhizobium sp. CO1-1-2]MBZ9694879.1 hypothetical protein [Mesorhizobium sp. CO1-1-9]MBZ9727999.1 hypothetical protein [Mesorhizobium sp. CO1-1-11]MBZ9755820.1 hypothetical protein [Mesorhizobium sp. ESP6-5]
MNALSEGDGTARLSLNGSSTKWEVKLPRQAFFCYPSSDFRLHAGLGMSA